MDLRRILFRQGFLATGFAGGTLRAASSTRRMEAKDDDDGAKHLEFFNPSLAMCSRLLQNDSEQPFVVEAPQIRVERLGLANHGLMTRKGLSEGLEAPISIDVINDECAVWS
jgi:hypothetical protein